MSIQIDSILQSALVFRIVVCVLHTTHDRLFTLNMRENPLSLKAAQGKPAEHKKAISHTGPLFVVDSDAERGGGWQLCYYQCRLNWIGIGSGFDMNESRDSPQLHKQHTYKSTHTHIHAQGEWKKVGKVTSRGRARQLQTGWVKLSKNSILWRLCEINFSSICWNHYMQMIVLIHYFYTLSVNVNHWSLELSLLPHHHRHTRAGISCGPVIFLEWPPLKTRES